MSEHLQQANDTVRRYSLASGAASLVPVPYFDMAAITATQILMLKKLSKEYGVAFREDIGKKIISSLLGGVISTTAATSVAGMLFRNIPVVGFTFSVCTMPTFAAASTYAVGRVFVMHFESGGTFLDLDPEKMRAYFQDAYKTKAVAKA